MKIMKDIRYIDYKLTNYSCVHSLGNSLETSEKPTLNSAALQPLKR